jgi:hypothetical protein
MNLSIARPRGTQNRSKGSLLEVEFVHHSDVRRTFTLRVTRDHVAFHKKVIAHGNEYNFVICKEWNVGTRGSADFDPISALTKVNLKRRSFSVATEQDSCLPVADADLPTGNFPCRHVTYLKSAQTVAAPVKRTRFLRRLRRVRESRRRCKKACPRQECQTPHLFSLSLQPVSAWVCRPGRSGRDPTLRQVLQKPGALIFSDRFEVKHLRLELEQEVRVLVVISGLQQVVAGEGADRVFALP